MSRGLSHSAAAARLARDGPNELPDAQPRSVLAIAWDTVREPMFVLLLRASGLYLVLGDVREALVLFASVFVVMGITFIQERKTERALEALRELASPRALVLRDDEWTLVPAREVVVGDLVRVKEGDRVPADATLLDAGSLMADESLLTGDSVPSASARTGPSRRWPGRAATTCPMSPLPTPFVPAFPPRWPYGAILSDGTPEPQARAMGFAAVVLGNIGLILTNRARDAALLETLRRPNPASWWVTGLALAGLGITLAVEPMREIFRFGALSAGQFAVSVGTAFAGLAWLEIYKALRPRARRAA